MDSTSIEIFGIFECNCFLISYKAHSYQNTADLYTYILCIYETLVSWQLSQKYPKIHPHGYEWVITGMVGC